MRLPHLEASSEPASLRLLTFAERRAVKGARASQRTLDGRRCKVEKGVRCGLRKLRRFRRAVFSAEAPKRNKSEMPKRERRRRGMSLPARTLLTHETYRRSRFFKKVSFRTHAKAQWPVLSPKAVDSFAIRKTAPKGVYSAS